MIRGRIDESLAALLLWREALFPQVGREKRPRFILP
jgi:hypothetical protein